ncbi:hypothetical protein J41TS12_10800 [Paenibacillus antibioticophila]|uniref:Phage abortive infection protein n=1 Tax=Paenibacillus antibioticophila TaxID=1274374 RepID=A0A920CGL4_9BACL|nr:hypothetical protein [Paenibacillus antibioticophila]GIO36219.1 hypothetical protein J41TS12_10800 [Paenibacillus antibioticophila]
MKKRYIVLVVMLIVGLWLCSWYFIPKWYGKEGLEAGTFGDMFGAVNALFSGLAFAGLIYTIAVQRQELSLQRKSIEMQTEELKMQREETARSANELEEQRKLMNFQIVLSTLNGMLAVKKDSIDNLAINQSTKGVATFNHIINLKKRSLETEIEKYRFHFNYFLSVYFDIIEYIINSELDDDQKKDLFNLLITHSGSDEVAVVQFLSENNQHRLLLLYAAQIGTKIKQRELSKNGVSI